MDAGHSREKAEAHAEVVRVFHRTTGIDFLRLTPGELLRFVGECDRQLEELDREEAAVLADPPPGETLH